VELTLNVTQGSPTQVVFYQGDSVLATVTQAPFTATSFSLPAGVHRFYARMYDGTRFAVTNLVAVTVGAQVPYSGIPHAVPGVIETGHYDVFEGGIGNGIAYQDGSVANLGNFRTDEYVDAQSHPSEGKTVGWITPGEWLEYTVDVAQAGLHNLSVRFASGNNQTQGLTAMKIQAIASNPNTIAAKVRARNRSDKVPPYSINNAEAVVPAV